MITNRPSISALACISLLATGMAATSARADDGAVSDINMKLSGYGGYGNAGKGGERISGLAASLSLPVDQRVGLQFDGALGGSPGDFFFDLGAHWFWRDPGTGLIGLYAGLARQIDSNHHQRVDRVGIEAERYFANLTFSGAAGYENGNNIHGAYGNAKVDYYLTPNFMTSSGYTYEAGLGYYSSRAEYQFSTDHELGLGLYVTSDWHSSDIYQVMGGLRLTIGEPMTLRDRHRHQDPASYLNADTIGTDQSEDANCGPTQEFPCGAAAHPS